MKKILVFGAEGQLGNAFLQSRDSEFTIIGATHQEADITDIGSVRKVIESAAPDIILNAAAYNKVEAADENPEAAYSVNALGAYAVARAAAQKGLPVISISTDYVFDGTREEGYEEGDVTHPINVYGASKDAGEKLVRIAHPSHWIIRTSALFGNRIEGGRGSSFVTKMLEAGKTGSVRVVSDQWTAPTLTNDLVAGIFSVIKKSVPFGTYHLVNEGSATWQEFAKLIFQEVDLPVSVEGISTEASGTAIARPRYSVLRNTLLREHGVLLPSWKDGLLRHLRELNGVS